MILFLKAVLQITQTNIHITLITLNAARIGRCSQHNRCVQLLCPVTCKRVKKSTSGDGKIFVTDRLYLHIIKDDRRAKVRGIVYES
jgi:hypothetical protein